MTGDFFTSRIELKNKNSNHPRTYLGALPSSPPFSYSWRWDGLRLRNNFSEMVTGWKRIRLSDYKPKNPLTVKEQFLAYRCNLSKSNSTVKKNGVWVNAQREVSGIRSAIRLRRNHRSYPEIISMAKKVRASKSATEIYDEIPYRRGWFMKELLKFADAELDIEGKSDSEIKALMMLEAL